MWLISESRYGLWFYFLSYTVFFFFCCGQDSKDSSAIHLLLCVSQHPLQLGRRHVTWAKAVKSLYVSSISLPQWGDCKRWVPRPQIPRKRLLGQYGNVMWVRNKLLLSVMTSIWENTHRNDKNHPTLLIAWFSFFKLMYSWFTMLY